jgi:thiamine-phosphate pyrophosphorylase
MKLSDRQAILRQADLYVVTSERMSGGRTSLDVLDAVLDAGVKMVQLREKEKSRKELFRLAEQFRTRTADRECLLIINDFVDLALAVDADGVHLGQSDLPIPAARRIAPELIIGASSHSLSQALAAQAEGADYVNIGPIYATNTKPDHPSILGPAALTEIGPRLKVPYTCMGGINKSNIGEVLKAGGKIIAVVTAVTQAEDMRKAASELREMIVSNRK